MKRILTILCILCLASCQRDQHVWCNCYGGTQNMDFDYGLQHDPSVASNQVRCDTDGIHHGYDTCLIQIVNK